MKCIGFKKILKFSIVEILWKMTRICSCICNWQIAKFFFVSIWYIQILINFQHNCLLCIIFQTVQQLAASSPSCFVLTYIRRHSQSIKIVRKSGNKRCGRLKISKCLIDIFHFDQRARKNADIIVDTKTCLGSNVTPRKKLKVSFKAKKFWTFSFLSNSESINFNRL